MDLRARPVRLGLHLPLWLVVVALVLRLGLDTVHDMRQAAGPAPVDDPRLAVLLSLCKAPVPGAGGGDEPAPPADGECPVCTLVAALPGMPPPPAAGVGGPAAPGRVAALDRPRFVTAFAPSRYAIRAPPAAA